MQSFPEITGVILAGGRAIRMQGQDKGLVMFKGIPLYQHVINKIKPQVTSMIIVANRNHDHYAVSGYPVFADSMEGFQGPLAGMLTGLEQSKSEWVLMVPCDMPFLPLTLVQQLWLQRNERFIAYASDGFDDHPILCLMHKDMSPLLRDFLSAGHRKVMQFFHRNQAACVEFAIDRVHFCNINTLEECEKWKMH